MLDPASDKLIVRRLSDAQIAEFKKKKKHIQILSGSRAEGLTRHGELVSISIGEYDFQHDLIELFIISTDIERLYIKFDSAEITCYYSVEHLSELRQLISTSTNSITRSKIMDEITHLIPAYIPQSVTNGLSNGISRDLLSDLQSELEIELQDIFARYGLKLHQVHLTPYSRKASTPVKTVSIEPEQACLVLNGKVVPLQKLTILGRAATDAVLASSVKNCHCFNNTNHLLINLPAETIPIRSARPVGVIRFDKVDNSWQIAAGWPSQATSDKIEVTSVDGAVSTYVYTKQPHPLQSIQKIIFHGAPDVEVLFIPPLARSHHLINPDTIIMMEGLGIWAGAGYAWMARGEYQNAVACFQRALEVSRSISALIELNQHLANLYALLEQDKQHNLHKNKAADLSRQYGIARIEPILSEQMFTRSEEKIPFSITFDNPTHFHLRAIYIEITCPGLGFIRKIKKSKLAANSQPLPLKCCLSPQVHGVHPVYFDFTFKVQGEERHSIVMEWIRVNPHKGNLVIDGDAGYIEVDHEVDVHIHGDAGAVVVIQPESS